jgi:hypothetical protein
MAPSPAARSSSELVLGFGASVGASVGAGAGELVLGFGASVGAGGGLLCGGGPLCGGLLGGSDLTGAGLDLPCGGAGPDLSRPTRGPSP